jgi:hypothetical protein
LHTMGPRHYSIEATPSSSRQSAAGRWYRSASLLRGATSVHAWYCLCLLSRSLLFGPITAWRNGRQSATADITRAETYLRTLKQMTK